MSRLTRSIQTRVAQIHASTLFAVILAIVAGLIFAWVFKMVFLNNKPKPVVAPPTRKLTVAATNILDKMQIAGGSVKTITVSEEEYNALIGDPKNRSRVMLTGMQPVGRTTTKPIRAEDPIYEDQLEPLLYPEPVSMRLREGKRAVMIEAPANGAMMQVGDRVDVYCTIANDNMVMANQGIMTAAIAKGLKVIARFGSTRTAAQPGPGTSRTYTLEASPYRANIINLARSVGGTFTLLVSPRQVGDDSITPADTSLDDPQTDRVTTEDLARIFGITPPGQVPVWEVERYTGVNRSGMFSFPGHVNGPGTQQQDRAIERPNGNGAEKSNGNGRNLLPPAGNGKPRNPITPASGPTSSNFRPPVPVGQSSSVAASYAARSNFGFRPAVTEKRCPTCAH